MQWTQVVRTWDSESNPIPEQARRLQAKQRTLSQRPQELRMDVLMTSSSSSSSIFPFQDLLCLNRWDSPLQGAWLWAFSVEGTRGPLQEEGALLVPGLCIRDQQPEHVYNWRTAPASPFAQYRTANACSTPHLPTLVPQLPLLTPQWSLSLATLLMLQPHLPRH